MFKVGLLKFPGLPDKSKNNKWKQNGRKIIAFKFLNTAIRDFKSFCGRRIITEADDRDNSATLERQDPKWRGVLLIVQNAFFASADFSLVFFVVLG